MSHGPQIDDLRLKVELMLSQLSREANYLQITYDELKEFVNAIKNYRSTIKIVNLYSAYNNTLGHQTIDLRNHICNFIADQRLTLSKLKSQDVQLEKQVQKAQKQIYQTVKSIDAINNKIVKLSSSNSSFPLSKLQKSVSKYQKVLSKLVSSLPEIMDKQEVFQLQTVDKLTQIHTDSLKKVQDILFMMSGTNYETELISELDMIHTRNNDRDPATEVKQYAEDMQNKVFHKQESSDPERFISESGRDEDNEEKPLMKK